MAEAILAAPDSAKTRHHLIRKLWKFISAYECIEAMENQNVLYGKVESDWPNSIAIALGFANSVLRETVSTISEGNELLKSEIQSLWQAYSVFECAQGKIEIELQMDANAVSSALELLNPELSDCICELASLPKPETLQ